MTVKQLEKELRKERYDTKATPVYVVVGKDRYELEAVSVYDGEVHLTAKYGDRPEDVVE
jgi:hypothetical protein